MGKKRKLSKKQFAVAESYYKPVHIKKKDSHLEVKKVDLSKTKKEQVVWIADSGSNIVIDFGSDSNCPFYADYGWDDGEKRGEGVVYSGPIKVSAVQKTYKYDVYCDGIKEDPEVVIKK